MAKNHSPIKNLSRLFDRVRHPVYVVSDQAIVIYANPACCNWTQVDHSKLLTARCVYKSDQIPNAIENRIRGLCPPPEMLTPDGPQQLRAKVCVDIDGIANWRHASMIALQDEQSKHYGVIVLCEEEHANDGGPDDSDNDSLHVLLRQLQIQSREQFSIENLVGISDFSSRLRRQVRAAIDSSGNILIEGPEGSGKEFLARSMSSPNRALPDAPHRLVFPIHGNIVDAEQVQSDLKMALQDQQHSGAPNEPGWLLVLNADQMSTEAQLELLGFLKLPDFRFQVISTANEPLIALSQSGSYSSELANMLCDISICLLPLKERKQDIPLLAQSIVERENPNRSQQVSGCSEELESLLMEFDWTGNLNQLASFLHAALANVASTQINVDDMPPEFDLAIKAQRTGSSQPEEINLTRYLEDIEAQLIRRALHQSKGNKTQAAKLLGISRAKLLRRIQHLLLEAPVFSEIDSGDIDSGDIAFEQELDSSRGADE